jgi:hypothetical protein
MPKIWPFNKGEQRTELVGPNPAEPADGTLTAAVTASTEATAPPGAPDAGIPGPGTPGPAAGGWPDGAGDFGASGDFGVNDPLLTAVLPVREDPAEAAPVSHPEPAREDPAEAAPVSHPEPAASPGAPDRAVAPDAHAGPAPAPGRDGEQGRPEPRQREAIPVAPHAGPVLAEPPPDQAAADARTPPPVVLVGNPRLGSDPGPLPLVQAAAPDSVLDGARLPRMVVRTASLRGDEHRHNGETRQDSLGLWILAHPSGLDRGQPVILACVADGVGSEPLSHLGSAEAGRLLHEQVQAQLPRMTGSKDPSPACRDVIANVAAGLAALATEHDLEPKQVSTTLIAALVIPRTQEQAGPAADLILFGVGDSKGFVLREGTWIPLGGATARDDELISTGTDALPTRPETTQFTERILYRGDMLMLCTDGLAVPLGLNASIKNQLAAWWGGQAPSLPEFYWQMSFRAQTYGDDRSAVCIWFDVDS